MSMNERGERVVRIEATTVTETGVAPGGAGPALSASGETDETEELREEIEQTRSELSETLTAIEEKLSPQSLMEQAKEAAHEAVGDAVDQTKEAVHEATIGKVEHMVSNVGDTARGLLGGSHERAMGRVTVSGGGGSTQPGIASAFVETIKENPLPTALAAFGLGWLWTHRAPAAPSVRTRYSASGAGPTGYDTRRVPYTRPEYESGGVGDTAGRAAGQVQSAVTDAANRVQDTAGQAAGQVQSAAAETAATVGDTVGQAASQAQSAAQGLVAGTQQQARQAQTQFQRLLRENPLAVGAVGLAVGAAVGLIIPETPQESQLLGGARDTLVDKAAGTAQDTLQKVGSVAQRAESAAESAAKEEAQARGLTG